MALALVNKEQHAKLDPLLQAEYQPLEGQDGMFQLKVEPVNGFALENVEGLKTTLGTVRAEKRKLEGALKKFEGIDPDEATQALKKVTEMADWNPDKVVAERVEAREKALKDQFQTELQKLTGDRDRLKSHLEKELITSVAMKAITEAGGSVELLLPIVQRYARMRPSDNGSFIAEVIDAQGNERIGDVNGNPMTIQMLVQEMKATPAYQRAFDASGSTGSGSQGTGAGSSGKGSQSRKSTVSIRDQSAMNASLEDIAAGKVTVVDG